MRKGRERPSRSGSDRNGDGNALALRHVSVNGTIVGVRLSMHACAVRVHVRTAICHLLQATYSDTVYLFRL